MAELPDNADFEALADVESLIRSAANYVRPSDDLRPRVLESARSVSKERQARRWIGHLATCALALGLLVAALRQTDTPARREPARAAVGYRLWSAQPALGANDASWSMVDSFTELRRRQAQLLRPAL
jgi:hypothetical protein